MLSRAGPDLPSKVSARDADASEQQMERLHLRPQTMVVSIEMQSPNEIAPSPQGLPKLYAQAKSGITYHQTYVASPNSSASHHSEKAVRIQSR
jgi:hypothetical protein